MCQKLHNQNEPVKTYPDISDWFYYDNKGDKQCTDGSERKYYRSFMTRNTSTLHHGKPKQTELI